MAPLPLQRVLGDEVATVYRDLHASHGVTFHCGVMLRELRGTDTVSAVVLADGTEIPADVVVIGVGIEPNVELAAAAGLDVAGGIVTDTSLRTPIRTSSPPATWPPSSTRCSVAPLGRGTGRTRSTAARPARSCWDCPLCTSGSRTSTATSTRWA